MCTPIKKHCNRDLSPPCRDLRYRGVGKRACSPGFLEEFFSETGLPVLGRRGSSEGEEGTQSELLNGSCESDGFSHNQAYRALQRDGLHVLPPGFSKPSFRFLFAEDVAPYAC